jgi:hypothetical protein
MDSPPELDLSPMKEFGPVDMSPYVPIWTLPYGFDPMRMTAYCGVIRSPPNLTKNVVKHPSPLATFDLRETIHPHSGDNGCLDTITRALLRPCQHCKLSGPEHFCILSEFEEEVEHMIEEMEVIAFGRDYDNKTCRMIIYYRIGLLCLGPFSKGKERRIPHCVVRRLQSAFPDRDGRHRLREDTVYMRRAYGGDLSIQARERPWTKKRLNKV